MFLFCSRGVKVAFQPVDVPPGAGSPTGGQHPECARHRALRHGNARAEVGRHGQPSCAETAAHPGSVEKHQFPAVAISSLVDVGEKDLPESGRFVATPDSFGEVTDVLLSLIHI